jgi:phage host-nuclease inhibitor protein Gam
MSKSRIKTASASIQTREEMEKLVGEICMLKTQEQSLTAEMNARLTEVRENFESGLSAIDEELKGKIALARDWAEANPSEFGRGKSIAMTHGDVGWRIGNPALRLLTGWNWEKVLTALTSLALKQYIRIKCEVNKEALIADREKLQDAGLRRFGVKIVQDEPFFIEPRLVATETRMQEEA